MAVRFGDRSDFIRRVLVVSTKNPETGNTDLYVRPIGTLDEMSIMMVNTIRSYFEALIEGGDDDQFPYQFPGSATLYAGPARDCGADTTDAPAAEHKPSTKKRKKPHQGFGKIVTQHQLQVAPVLLIKEGLENGQRIVLAMHVNHILELAMRLQELAARNAGEGIPNDGTR
jgi:hypothetical protein